MNQEDVAELKSLLQASKRPKVKVFLENEIVRQEARLSLASQPVVQAAPKVKSPVKKKGIVRFSQFSSYYWDESSTRLKVYIDFEDMKAPKECTYTVEFPNPNAFQFRLSTASGKHRELRITNLHGGLEKDGAKVVLKKGKAILNFEKSESGKWYSLKKKKEEEKTPDFDKKADPQAGMMQMMKKMYDDGDDEMKRMLNKTWYESRMKEKEKEGGEGK